MNKEGVGFGRKVLIHGAKIVAAAQNRREWRIVLQVLIQTPESPGQNALSKEALLKHVRVMEQIATLKVTIDQV